jgi:hypothetical protein
MNDRQHEKEGKQQVDILLKEYETVRADIQQTIGRAKAHVRHFQIVLGAIVGLFAVVVRRDTDIADNIIFWIFVMYSITTIVAYLVFDMVEIQYGIEIGGARCGVLEEILNKRFGEALLVWETEIATKLFDPRERIKGVFPPAAFLTTFEVILILIAIFSVPGYFFYEFWDKAGSTARAFVILNVVYSAIVVGMFSWSVLSVTTLTKKGTRERILGAIKKINAEKFDKHDLPIAENKPRRSTGHQSHST